MNLVANKSIGIIVVCILIVVVSVVSGVVIVKYYNQKQQTAQPETSQETAKETSSSLTEPPNELVSGIPPADATPEELASFPVDHVKIIYNADNKKPNTNILNGADSPGNIETIDNTTLIKTEQFNDEPFVRPFDTRDPMLR